MGGIGNFGLFIPKPLALLHQALPGFVLNPGCNNCVEWQDPPYFQQ